MLTVRCDNDDPSTGHVAKDLYYELQKSLNVLTTGNEPMRAVIEQTKKLINKIIQRMRE